MTNNIPIVIKVSWCKELTCVCGLACSCASGRTLGVMRAVNCTQLVLAGTQSFAGLLRAMNQQWTRLTWRICNNKTGSQLGFFCELWIHRAAESRRPIESHSISTSEKSGVQSCDIEKTDQSQGALDPVPGVSEQKHRDTMAKLTVYRRATLKYKQPITFAFTSMANWVFSEACLQRLWKEDAVPGENLHRHKLHGERPQGWGSNPQPSGWDTANTQESICTFSERQSNKQTNWNETKHIQTKTYILTFRHIYQSTELIKKLKV